MTADQRLYFSHSYALEDLRFNEYFWRLLEREGFEAWIDAGREIAATGPGAAARQPGALRPMDISFNEWMLSKCDGFVAVVPEGRKSFYQQLEYRTATRMGVPRLVVLPDTVSGFGASEREAVTFPTSWERLWQPKTEQLLVRQIRKFAKLVGKYRAAGEILTTVNRWVPRRTTKDLHVALLAPRANDPEWQSLQTHLQQYAQVNWTLLSPANFQTEAQLLSNQAFDLLVVDVGPRGTPKESLGYIHAIGIPQVRLCRVNDEIEKKEFGRYLDPAQGRRERFVYEQKAPDLVPAPAVSRFMDGAKLDSKMEPVIFWVTPEEAAERIRATARRIVTFSSGLPPEKGGAATIDSHRSARKYFDQYWDRAGRGSVFISFAGSGGAAKLADRLAQILRFHDLRCFHYRDKEDSESRLESGEEVLDGLALRINDVDIVLYLVEDSFKASPYCLREARQGRELLERGSVTLRAYSLDTLGQAPQELAGLNIYAFREADWSDNSVEEKIVADIDEAANALGWTLREKERATLLQWLQEDRRASIDGVFGLLQQFAGLPESEIESAIGTRVESTADTAWLDAVLRLPKDRDKRKRARHIVALLLLALATVAPSRQPIVRDWLYRRRLLHWPSWKAGAVAAEDVVTIDKVLITLEKEPTLDAMKEIGQKIAQQFKDLLRGRESLCVTAETDFLSLPIEWSRETQDDEPLGVRRPVRWRLPDTDSRDCLVDRMVAKEIPPATLILAFHGPAINPAAQARQLEALLRASYAELGWPPELVRNFECRDARDIRSRLGGCKEQVIHIAGHMGEAGLQIGNEIVDATELAGLLTTSECRLLVLNGCDGGNPVSSLAASYLTLADRLVRDARIPEVVAHRCKIGETDALAFAKAFYKEFFKNEDGFDTSRSTLVARKAGSVPLRYSPVVISQRKPAGS